MKFCILLTILVVASVKSYSQSEKNYLIGFFVNGFNNDSVRVLLNKDTIKETRLKSDPLLGQCNDYLLVRLTDSEQILTIFEVERGKSFKTVIKKGCQYLYIFRLNDEYYDFNYSNKLRLPE
jgi:hypothetical protein